MLEKPYSLKFRRYQNVQVPQRLFVFKLKKKTTIEYTNSVFVFAVLIIQLFLAHTVYVFTVFNLHFVHQSGENISYSTIDKHLLFEA